MNRYITLFTLVIYITCYNFIPIYSMDDHENNQQNSFLCKGFEQLPVTVIAIILHFLDTPESIAELEYQRGANPAYNLEDPTTYYTASTKLKHSCILLYKLFKQEKNIYTVKWLTQLFYQQLDAIDRNKLILNDQWFKTIQETLLNNPGTTFIFNDYNYNVNVKLQNNIVKEKYIHLLSTCINTNNYHHIIIIHDGYELLSNVLNNEVDGLIHKLKKISINLAGNKIQHLSLPNSINQKITFLILLNATTNNLIELSNIQFLIESMNNHALETLSIHQKKTAALSLPPYFKNLHKIKHFYLDKSDYYTDTLPTRLDNLPVNLQQIIIPKRNWNDAFIVELSEKYHNPEIKIIIKNFIQNHIDSNKTTSHTKELTNNTLPNVASENHTNVFNFLQTNCIIQ